MTTIFFSRSFGTGLLLLTVGVALGGCADLSIPIRPSPLSNPSRPAIAAGNYLVHLPGMSGWSITDLEMVTGLYEGGVADHVEYYDWTGPHWMIGAVWAVKDNQAEAQHVADAIAKKMRENPQARIILTSWSAGAAIIIWALEDLPPDVQVQSVMMVQPAVDPGHDLTAALRHVRGHMFTTYSGNDWLVLGMGAAIFGTTDGNIHSPAAGFAGFSTPANSDANEYRKLVQIPYDIGWIRYGDFGDHISQMSGGVAKEVLAPMLIKDAK